MFIIDELELLPCDVDTIFMILQIQKTLLLFKNLIILKFLNSNNLFHNSDIEKLKLTLHSESFLFS